MPFDGVSVKRMLRSRRARVFEAWTRADWMARWFFPGEGCELSDHGDRTELVLTHELPPDPKIRRGHQDSTWT